MLKHISHFLRMVIQHIRFVLFVSLVFWIIPSSTVNMNGLFNAIAFHISDYNFDYIGWELDALGGKLQQVIFGKHAYLSPEDSAQYVRDYMADLVHAQQLEAEIQRIHTDPAVDNPERATVSQQAERDTLRDSLRRRQFTVEAILEGQVASVLVEEGFGVAGQLFPPLSMHFTEVPNLLIVSPRDAIRFEVSLNLIPLPLEQSADIETFIDETYDVSSLIVPLGGIALYPAMIFETASISYSVEVFAHEWAHHYLYFYPLGLSYFTGGDGFASEARIINETTADIFGKVIARKVLQRYYPDHQSPTLPAISAPEPDVALPPVDDPDRFDFGATMNETRVTVDELLAAGKVEEAEAYMESQRVLFVENGYRIRKLNQAYFAFYGGYQSGDIPGIGGADPIGPNVRAVLEASDDVQAYLHQMRWITTRDELLALVDTLD
jgi:hypothetical protein